MSHMTFNLHALSRPWPGPHAYILTNNLRKTKEAYRKLAASRRMHERTADDVCHDVVMVRAARLGQGRRCKLTD